MVAMATEADMEGNRDGTSAFDRLSRLSDRPLSVTLGHWVVLLLLLHFTHVFCPGPTHKRRGSGDTSPNPGACGVWLL